MRRLIAVGIVLTIASIAMAREDKVKLTGYVIDNACSARATGEGGADKVKAHTVKCAQMPPCVKSGYAIYADGKLYKLDEEGNKKVADILKNTKVEKGLSVSVEGTVDRDTLHATKIPESKYSIFTGTHFRKRARAKRSSPFGCVRPAGCSYLKVKVIAAIRRRHLRR